MEDALPVLRRLWAGEEVSHDGPAGSFAGVSVSPRPAQDPFDVWLGGNVPAALERCGRLADGWIPAFCTPGDAAAGKAVIDRVAAEHGRAISPEHFGVSLAYAPEGTDLAALASSPLARRARGRPLEEIIPVGLGGLARHAGALPRGRVLQVHRAPDGAAGGVAARARAPGRRGGRPADVTGGSEPTPTLPRMPERPLTLMAVHAHPDDEAIGTGGILARYGDEGVRTVLVTCTNGELGDAPGGVKPGEPGHDERIVVPLRRRELEASCDVLGVSHLELLGYHDSGMEGWPQNDAPDTFWRTPVEEAAQPAGRPDARLRAAGRRDLRRERLLRAPRPHSGQPGDPRGDRRVRHPGQAVLHRRGPLAASAGFGEMLAEAGMERPAEVEENPDFGTPDELITTTIDCSAVAGRKYASLAAHASQSDNIFFLQMGEELFSTIMGSESFVRVATRRARRCPRTTSSPDSADRRARAGPAPHREKGTQARFGVVPTSRCRPGKSRRERGEPIRRDRVPRRR